MRLSEIDSSSSSPRAGTRRATPADRLAGIARLASLALAVVLLAAPLAQAQDWGDDSSEDWNEPAPTSSTPRTSSSTSSSRSSFSSSAAGWSVRGGVGFTADPETFLMNFEAPYAFNEWVSAGPMLQIGLEDHRAIVAPVGNLIFTIPDLPGNDFDRVRPYGFAGLGFAWIEKDRGRNDGDGVGFLIDFGAGVEYQVSEKVFVGTQMMFNFLPKETKGEGFYFAWQLAGIRFAF